MMHVQNWTISGLKVESDVCSDVDHHTSEETYMVGHVCSSGNQIINPYPSISCIMSIERLN